MSKLIKRRFNVGIGRETSRGTKVAPGVWIKPTSEEFNEVIEPVITERSMGVIEDSDDMVVAKGYSSGSIAGEVFDESIGFILYALFGACSSEEVDGQAGVYDHTFTVSESAQHQSLTLEIKRGDNEQVAYPNAVLENLTLNFDPLSYVTWEADFLAHKGESATNSPSYSDENYFMGKNAVVSVADDYSSIGSATELDITNFSLDSAKNIEAEDLLGSDEPNDFLNKQMAVEGSFTINFASVTQRDWVLDNTSKAMRIKLENDSVTIGTDTHPSLTLDLAKVKFSEGLITGGNNDIAKVDISFKAFYSSDDSFAYKAVLRNEKASY